MSQPANSHQPVEYVLREQAKEVADSWIVAAQAIHHTHYSAEAEAADEELTQLILHTHKRTQYIKWILPREPLLEAPAEFTLQQKKEWREQRLRHPIPPSDRDSSLYWFCFYWINRSNRWAISSEQQQTGDWYCFEAQWNKHPIPLRQPVFPATFQTAPTAQEQQHWNHVLQARITRTRLIYERE